MKKQCKMKAQRFVCNTKLDQMEIQLLNLGCGATRHPAWINVDLSGDEDTLAIDVCTGLPFPEENFDVVYHSHLLEHIPKDAANFLMAECSRVLKPGGIIRVLVPDLEQIARLYLDKLSTANVSEADYDWIMLELFDQCIRQESGGNMERYMLSSYAHLSQFVVSRMGASAAQCGESPKIKPTFIKPTWRNFARLIYRLRLEFAKLTVYVVTGEKGRDAFQEGLFRNSGEVHRWMYDRFSLGKLMANAGFVEINVVSPFESRIKDFARYELDVSGGVARKPDSLVMEGIKP